MGQIQLLFQLQQLDDEIRAGKQRLGEVLRAQKETEPLLAARRRAEKAASDLQKWQASHRDLNLELEGLTAKAGRSENRLYSGNVTNPKELADLQHEIESLGRRRAVLEDEILEAMIMIEDAEVEHQSASETLATVERSWESSQERLKQEQKSLALSLHELAGRRKDQTRRIEPARLAEYDRLSRSKQGVAVAALKNNICQGCRLTVSAHIMKAVNEGQLVHCDSCGRLLSPA